MLREIKKRVLKQCLILISVILVSLIASSCISPGTTPASNLCQNTFRHQILVQPDDIRKTNKETILCYISHARQSIYLTMYELKDPDIINAMVAAKTANKNLDIRVIFNCSSFEVCNQPGQDDSRDPNASAKQVFSNAGIAWKNADPTFAVTHQKTFTFDNKTSIIMTFNLNSDYFVSTRDFAVITNDKDEVNEIAAVFLNDWSTPVKPGSPVLLTWSPSSSRQRIKSVIASANKSIDIYMEEFVDHDIAEALVAASRRLNASGGKVRVITAVLSSADNLAKDGNLPIRQYLNKNGVLARYGAWHINSRDDNSPIMYIHAKMVLADYGVSNAQAYVGSANFSPTSLEKNRELGIVLKKNVDAGLLDVLNKIFSDDWTKCLTDPEN